MEYLHNGHKVDLYTSLAGHYAFLDDDLEPLDVSDEEYLEIVSNGTLIR